jgi:hypothetical protein
MKRRMSQEEFDVFYEAVWQIGPQARYSNPDSWLNRMSALSADKHFA